MTRDLKRLLSPQSIAVIGGGAWCKAVIEQLQKIGFEGDIWPVHAKADQVAGIKAVPRIEDLPAPPDASFVGVNRHTTVEIVSALSNMNAGGVVCFASGFLEAKEEDAQGADLQDALLKAAGEMPILGPNCYGFINYLDQALLWPDQHGGVPCKSGVAIITQSSNIAINLTMQTRALPIAYVVTAGNQAQMGVSEIGSALLDDPRVTALGLHIEGIGDIRALEALAKKAQELGKPIVALKVGRSEAAQVAAVSHTASLSGQDAGASALLERLCIARVNDLAIFLETLKLFHLEGRLKSNRMATISCSGGEASLAADIGHGFDVDLPALNDRQRNDLRAALGPMVALANPLDYHTYIWRDVPAMTAAFGAMIDPNLAITLLIVDFPRADRCDPSDWDCVIEAAIATRQQTGGCLGMVSSLPETMPEDVAERLLKAGVVPFSGLPEAIATIEVAGRARAWSDLPVFLPSPTVAADLILERDAKLALADFGLDIPNAIVVASPRAASEAAMQLGGTLVLKATGLAHKTEAGGVTLGLLPSEVEAAAQAMPSRQFLVEEMILDGVAELLVGVIKDPAHGFVMTLGAGGVWTELMSDTTSVLLPLTDQMIDQALDRLNVSKLLDGYRGNPPADRAALHKAIRAIEGYVLDHGNGLEEIEINPLICTESRAIAADALIRRKD